MLELEILKFLKMSKGSSKFKKKLAVIGTVDTYENFE